MPTDDPNTRPASGAPAAPGGAGPAAARPPSAATAHGTPPGDAAGEHAVDTACESVAGEEDPGAADDPTSTSAAVPNGPGGIPDSHHHPHLHPHPGPHQR